MIWLGVLIVILILFVADFVSISSGISDGSGATRVVWPITEDRLLNAEL